MELLGRTLGHYRVIEELGRGGMGIVYRAEDLRLGRQVALKALAPEVAQNEDRIERLRREARSLASLNHPSIVTLYGVEEIDGHLFLAMELVEGKTLGEHVPPGGLAMEEFFRLAIPLVDAVSAAHQQSIVHRDLKPGNVMLTAEGRIKVLDFGLAKLQVSAAASNVSQLASEALTATGTVIGSAPYMAPEQIRAGFTDERSDIFSLGVVLYQMAAGRHPFRTESQADVLTSILRDDPPSLSTLKPALPHQLDRILRCALDKDPERRFQSAKELRNQLERLVDEVTKGTATRGAIPISPPPARKVRWRLVVGAVAVLLVAAGIGGIGVWSYRSRHQPAPPLVLPHLAVTELRRFSGEVGPEYYRSGLVAALAERLSGLQGVWVLPPGSTDPLPDLLVEADVRRLSDAVTLQLRVHERQSRRILGSEVLEGSAREPYDLLDRAGAFVAAWLQAEAKLPARYEAGPAPTQDPAAFDLFLRAQDRVTGRRGPPDPQVALVLVRKAIDADPRFAPAWALAGEVLWRRYLETRTPKNLDDTAEACRQASEIDPELAAAHLCLARVRQVLQNPIEAQEEYIRAIELQPTSLDAYNDLHQIFLDMGVPQAAERTWQRIIDLHPDYWAGYSFLGTFYYDSDRWPSAAEYYRRALDLAPNNAAVQRELGTANHLLGRYEEAITAYQKSIDIRPNWGGYANLGDLYFLLRRFPEAVESAEQAVQFPEATHVAFGILGKAYFWAGRQNEAATAFERAVAQCREQLGRKPDDATAWIWLAYDLAMLKRRKESLEALEKALLQRPNDAHYSYFAALIYNRLGDREQALSRLEQAVAGGYGRAEMRTSVEVENLQNEPRFRALLAGG